MWHFTLNIPFDEFLGTIKLYIQEGENLQSSLYRPHVENLETEYILKDYEHWYHKLMTLFSPPIINGHHSFSDVFEGRLCRVKEYNSQKDDLSDIRDCYKDVFELMYFVQILNISDIIKDPDSVTKFFTAEDAINLVKEKLSVLYATEYYYTIDDILSGNLKQEFEDDFGKQIGLELVRQGYAEQIKSKEPYEEYKFKLTRIGKERADKEKRLGELDKVEINRNNSLIEISIDKLLEEISQLKIFNVKLLGEIQELKNLTKNPTISDKTLGEVIIAKMFKMQVNNLIEDKSERSQIAERLAQIYNKTTGESFFKGRAELGISSEK